MLVLGFTFTLAAARQAEACGCFAPPNTVTPIVQAGERILFAHDGTNIVAYIQISYQGSASDFGWLVPLPTVPTLELGSNELFQALESRTDPKFTTTTTRIQCNYPPPRYYGGSPSETYSDSGSTGGCSGGGASANFGNSPDLGASFGGESDLGAFFPDAAAAADLSPPSPVVSSSDIGPYDYAVLKADDSTAMFQWLSDNHYYVPTGTMNVVAPYIHPGAYFLALKLKSGASSGDIQPVVLRYASDLPMIPLVLTSVGAIDNMGIEVFLLGQARAIPRNYYHVVLDEMAYWLGEDYNALLIRGVSEAPMHHAFVTEYAGTSSIMSQALAPAWRFGDRTTLELDTNPLTYINYLQTHSFNFDTTMIAILSKYLPEPDSLRNQGVTPEQYYSQYQLYAQVPDIVDGGTAPQFDPVACTDELWTRVVQPTQATQMLFDTTPYLTRLYTAISPIDMTADPVFSENPDLPGVSNLHSANVTIPCSGQSWIDADPFSSQLPNSIFLPGARRIETLRESGLPTVNTDNDVKIETAIGPVTKNYDQTPPGYDTPSNPPSSQTQPQPARSTGCACDLGAGRMRLDAAFLLLGALALLGWRRRRDANVAARTPNRR
jgi:hypothetical protein